MCDTDEHMLLGDTAAAWIPQMLQNLMDKLGCPPSNYDTSATNGKNVFGSSGWFTDFSDGQFKFGSGTLDYASYGDILALSGDYFASETEIISGVSTVEALLAAWHEKLKVPTSTLIDPDTWSMIHRAMENWPHFGFEAVEMWLKTHREAIQLAISGHDGTFNDQDISTQDQGFTKLTAALMVALRHNAFGDHYLSDLFSAGHMRVARLGLYEYLNGGHPVRATSKWLIPYTDTFTGGKGPKGEPAECCDISSVLSGISHDEDGAFGLWCQLLFGPCTLNGLDGVTGLAGHMADPDHPGVQLATDWAGPRSGDIDSFYARGDNGMNDPNAAPNLDLCHYAIGLSIRDILIASITGKDPSDPAVLSIFDYWDAVGGQPNPPNPSNPFPLYAALKLIPKPDEPANDWPSTKSNFDGKKNHYPLFMPDYGLSTYYDNLKIQMTGGTRTPPASYTVRGTTSSLTAWSALSPILCSHGEYAPGVNTYVDYLDLLQNGDSSASLTGDAWRTLEYPRVLERYARDKGPGEYAGYKEEAKRGIAAAEKKLNDDADALEQKAQATEDATKIVAPFVKQAMLDQAAAMRARANQMAAYSPSWW